MSMSPFSFLLNPSIPLPLPDSLAESVYESVSVLLVCSVCSLDSTWVNSYGICLSLTGLFISIIFSRSIHAVAKGKIFLLFYGQVVFHCVNVPHGHFFYPAWCGSVDWVPACELKDSCIPGWYLLGDGVCKRSLWKVILWEFSAMKLHKNSKYRVNNVRDFSSS